MKKNNSRPLISIGIDINEANVKNRVGTGQYVYRLLKYFSSHSELDFHLYHRDSLQDDLPRESKYWHYHHVGPTRGWISFGLPVYLATHPKNNIWWSPAHYLPRITGCPSVVTIHDLAYEFFPDLFLPGDLYKLKNWTRSAVKQATRIIAVSSATKSDIVNVYGIGEEKIEVVPNGYDDKIYNLKREINSDILKTYSLNKQEYLLFVGTIQPRKNVIKLVQAFRLLKSSGYKGKLVIAGKIGWLAEDTFGVIKNSEDAKDIVMTGYISDDAQTALYQNADVFILPSLYEGFGVPVLEAMACGAPVVAANNSSLPEVVGDAGILFNASDPAELVESIRQLQKERDKWVKKGLTHVKQFSWDKCARETLKVLVNSVKSGR